jgi:hypothetical protein
MLVLLGATLALSLGPVLVSWRRRTTTRATLENVRRGRFIVPVNYPDGVSSSLYVKEFSEAIRRGDEIRSCASCVYDMDHLVSAGAPNVFQHEEVRDGWGNRLVFRYPGPVHKDGWDLYSVGPNGVDDRGDRDDILVGEDVAPEVTGRR